jgi:hypothetical protein
MQGCRRGSPRANLRPAPPTSPLQVGEFVEVSNGSKTDPCAWIGRVTEATVGGLKVGPRPPGREMRRQRQPPLPALLTLGSRQRAPHAQLHVRSVHTSWRPKRTKHDTPVPLLHAPP